ncbi:MAG: hypothetical protein ACOX56_00580 [Acholeplasmataceae bacterium]|jgi:hypothetical protein
MKKICIFLLILITAIFIPTVKVNASYNYTPWADTIPSAHAMKLVKVITNANFVDTEGNPPAEIIPKVLETEEDRIVRAVLDDLRDVFAYEDKIFVVDGKENKVYMLNENFEYIKTFPSAMALEQNPTFYSLTSPQGVYAINNTLYIADTEGEKIAIYNITTGNMIGRITQSQLEEQHEVFKTARFKPQKIVVDNTGRMMVISKDTFEGILEFDENRKFTRFFGTNIVQFDFFKAVVYKLASKSQKAKMSLNLQTSFTSIDIDDYGYLYTVSRNETTNPVKKMNFKGRNILVNNGYIPVVGDTKFPTWRENVPLGPSTIIDVTCHDDNNRFSILDSNRGRIFTYDFEGHLLYIFGGLDNQGGLQSPTSITYMGENIIVTDNISKAIFVYKPTEFGELVNLATTKYYDMKYDEAQELWERVIELNSNYFLAYAGIGKSQLRKQEWEPAVKNLKLGHDYYNYSKAYEQYRNQKISKVVPYVVIGILIIASYGLFSSIRQSIRRDKGGLD